MIFSGNTTALGASTIPMAEGYDTSCGVGLALVESARNDLAVFKAMIQADYKELAICRESTGYVQEGEISALHEAVGGGIFKKIADLIRKLIAKIKSIFHNFMAKINGLVMKDKDLVKKYEKELGRKANIDKLEVKWRKYNEAVPADLFKIETFEFDEEDLALWDEDSEVRFSKVTKELTKNKISADNVTELSEELEEAFLEDEEELELREIGGWRKVANFIRDYDSLSRKMNSNINNCTNKLEKAVNNANKKANDAVKTQSKVERDKESDDAEKLVAKYDVTDANKIYDVAVTSQTVMQVLMQSAVQINTIIYKQNKAAFMKAVVANPKKLEETAIYAEAVAEAAADEVDRVINSALSDEEISDLSTASTNVLDGDVKDDPDALTYGPNQYTKNASFSNSDGSIDSNIGGGKVEESYFGSMFY